ncbi:hypothetical protein AGLY_014534 [Aphis glycines]|uniref:Uncharacterized protein n=1 Tax=Aphis glycines TaxID=307491 RepID=A0A6G0T395_APHGL|nr:hypothetical protein AGLY_014534 [Aphis glycines]
MYTNPTTCELRLQHRGGGGGGARPSVYSRHIANAKHTSIYHRLSAVTVSIDNNIIVQGAAGHRQAAGVRRLRMRGAVDDVLSQDRTHTHTHTHTRAHTRTPTVSSIVCLFFSVKKKTKYRVVANGRRLRARCSPLSRHGGLAFLICAATEWTGRPWSLKRQQLGNRRRRLDDYFFFCNSGFNFFFFALSAGTRRPAAPFCNTYTHTHTHTHTHTNTSVENDCCVHVMNVIDANGTEQTTLRYVWPQDDRDSVAVGLLLLAD